MGLQGRQANIASLLKLVGLEVALGLGQEVGAFGADIPGDGIGFGILRVVLPPSSTYSCYSALVGGGRTYACIGQQGIDQEGAAEIRLDQAHGHVLDKGAVVEKGEEGVVPDEIEGHQVGDQVIVVGDGGPWFGGDAKGGTAAQISNIHDLRAKPRRLTFDLDAASEALQLIDGVSVGRGGPGPGQRAIEVGPHVVQGGMVADHVQQGRSMVRVGGSHNLEEIV